LDVVPEDCLVVFVMATYGEGEPTDNAVDFWEVLTQEIPQFSESTDGDKPLTNLRYVAFGLGNKTYEHYNSVIRTVDKRLLELGAQRVGERGEGDDDGSMEEDFLGWQEDMWPAFCDALGIDKDDIHTGSRQPVYSVQELLDFDQAKVFFGELSETLKAEV
jgi:NADPH-ferrihemoprotein reductase